MGVSPLFSLSRTDPLTSAPVGGFSPCENPRKARNTLPRKMHPLSRPISGSSHNPDTEMTFQIPELNGLECQRLLIVSDQVTGNPYRNCREGQAPLRCKLLSPLRGGAEDAFCSFPAAFSEPTGQGRAPQEPGQDRGLSLEAGARGDVRPFMNFRSPAHLRSGSSLGLPAGNQQTLTALATLDELNAGEFLPPSAGKGKIDSVPQP